MTSVDHDFGQSLNRSEPQAFDDLYSKYQTSVYRFAYYLVQNRGEADDLFQETWLRVAQHFQKIQNVRDFRAWIFAIASNLHRDVLRKKRIRRLFSKQTPRFSEQKNNDSNELSVSEESTEDHMQMRMGIRRALAQLPARQSQIFILKEIEGFKHSEISEILRIPEGTVKSLMHRAVKKLQRELSDYRSEF